MEQDGYSSSATDGSVTHDDETGSTDGTGSSSDNEVSGSSSADDGSSSLASLTDEEESDEEDEDGGEPEPPPRKRPRRVDDDDNAPPPLLVRAEAAARRGRSTGPCPPEPLLRSSSSLSPGAAVAVLAFWGRGAPHVRGAAERLLRHAGVFPCAAVGSLARQHRRMHAAMRRWLVRLGRSEGEDGGGGLRLTVDDRRRLGDADAAPLAPHFRPTGADVRRLMASTLVSQIGGGNDGAGDDDVLLPAGHAHPDLARLVDPLRSDRWPPEFYLDSQRLAVSGPVHVLWDFRAAPGGGGGGAPTLVPLPQPTDPRLLPVCVSVPGLNLAYARQDRGAFLDHGGQRLRTEPALQRMRLVWYHLLALWRHHGVVVGAACAIGCGAFAGPFAAQLPALWAHALVDVLARHDFGLRLLVLCMPGNAANFAAYRGVLARHGARLRTPVVLTGLHSMASVAAAVGPALGLRGGLLNPSDVVALRMGFLGMYWDGGHVALEEVLAVQTTLLLQHYDLNPAPFDDARRLVLREPALL